jgi:hypothetical protein
MFDFKNHVINQRAMQPALEFKLWLIGAAGNTLKRELQL